MLLNSENYYESLKASTDEKSQIALKALEKTLTHFQVLQDHDTMAEILLRFAIVQDENELVPIDNTTKKLFEMFEFFKKELA